MGHKITICGKTEKFTKRFRDILRDCGYEPDVEGPPSSRQISGPRDLCIFEVEGKDDVGQVADVNEAQPFLLYSEMCFTPEEAASLREKGLMGVITDRTTPEDIAFLVNKALFYNKMLKRNPRVPVNLPVEVRAGSKVMKTFSSLLSRDGMFVVTLNPIEVNLTCAIEFSLPGLKKFSSTAKVLYNILINKDLNIISNPRDPFKRLVAHPGMAVFFTDMPQEDRELIDRYIETIL